MSCITLVENGVGPKTLFSVIWFKFDIEMIITDVMPSTYVTGVVIKQNTYHVLLSFIFFCSALSSSFFFLSVSLLKKGPLITTVVHSTSSCMVL